MQQEFLQSTSRRVALKAYLSSDHISVATGKTIAVVISKNGGSFASPNAGATNATEIANGWYYVDLDTADTATLGPIIVRGTSATIDDTEVIAQIVKATNRGMTGIPDAVAGASSGLHINGSNSGTTTYAAVTITGTFTVSDGFVVDRSTSNAAAVLFTGNGTGHGIICTSGLGATGDGAKFVSAATNGNALNLVGVGTGTGLLTTGGVTGHGASFQGGSSSGNGINSIANNSGHGINANGAGTTKHGINAAGGATTSHGINATGGGIGHGILATSGVGATGDGIKAIAASTNGNALNLVGIGTGAGILSTAGLTGIGASFVGGGTFGVGVSIATTSGDGLSITPTAGNAIVATANGTSKHGFIITGGTAGTSDGLKAVAGTGGVDIRGAITGNITGSISGSAGSISGITFPTNFSSLSVDGSGRVDVGKVGGTGQTARDLGASVLISAGIGTGQLDFSGGVVKANATQWLGGTIPAVNVTGVPLVDASYLLGTAFSTPATAGIVDVNVKRINNATASTPGASGGVMIAGSNAATTFASVMVTGTTTMSDGLVVNRSTSNGTAITATGNGTGSGAIITSGSGATGNGVKFIAASTNGSGLVLTGTGTGYDFNLTTPNTTLPSSALTAGAVATAVWQDTTSGDFTVASSIGKSLYTGGIAPGAASGLSTNAASGYLPVDVKAINGSTNAAVNQALVLDVIFAGSVDGTATTTTLIDSTLTQAVDGHFNGRVIIFTNNTLRYRATIITDFDAANHKLTFSMIGAVPSFGDTFVII